MRRLFCALIESSVAAVRTGEVTDTPSVAQPSPRHLIPPDVAHASLAALAAAPAQRRGGLTKWPHPSYPLAAILSALNRSSTFVPTLLPVSGFFLLLLWLSFQF